MRPQACRLSTDSAQMAPALERAVATTQLVAGIGFAGFALHTVLPDGEAVAHAFDYYV